MLKTKNDFYDPRLADKSWRMSHLYKIVDRKSKIITFVPNEAQQHYIKNKHTRNVILKSRRLGFTTYSIIDMKDNTLYNKNYNSLFVSYDDPSAKKVFDEMVMVAWNHFEFQDDYTVDMSNANMLKLDFGDKTKSKIEVKSTGRGGRNNQIHISELGRMSKKYPAKASEMFAGTLTSIVAGGEITIESTAEGDQGEFPELFWKAYNKTLTPGYKFKAHEFKAHFYNWQWDTEEINEMVKEPDPNVPKQFKDYQKKHNEKAKKMPEFYRPITDIQITYWYYKFEEVNYRWARLLQEYPTTPEEAFQSAGAKLFDSVKLEDHKQHITTPNQTGDWEIFEEPILNHTYVIGVDPSEGVGGDHSAIVIVDFTPKTPRVVATYTNNWIAPDLLAYEIKNKAVLYNNPLTIIERNNTGHATIAQLKHIYPPELIYCEVKFDKEENVETERMGWHTNAATKPRMFFELSTAMNDDSLIIPSAPLLSEMRLYDKSSLQKVKADPDATNHFDLLTALAIAYQGRIEAVETNSVIKTTNIHTPQPTKKDPFAKQNNDDSKITTSNPRRAFNPFDAL